MKMKQETQKHLLDKLKNAEKLKKCSYNNRGRCCKIRGENKV